MKTTLNYTLTILCLLLVSHTLHAQLNVELLHQLVQHSKDENSRQNTARNKQALTTANEKVNMDKTGELKEGYAALQSRFNTLGEVMQVLSLGIEAAPVVRSITHTQQQLITLASDKPFLLPVALVGQREIGRKATRLARYLTGIFITMEDINQMKQSDRRMLYSYALEELRALSGISSSLVRSMYAAAEAKSRGAVPAFSDFINQDTPIAQEILEGLKELE
ncbi:hypothetical protein [Sphingobacterium sp. JB170]|uniref:hypothetical protein n=1 Tax=Sphingobacterium sp. JB170 TaxID=1434842 RepID=UPI00097EE804|nr:hypothetical protein [Sphingobacterium sp. JB170]SJN47944.1 hypothetical protein FM107_16510 [Sphingobacterium sp. JB170]